MSGWTFKGFTAWAQRLEEEIAMLKAGIESSPSVDEWNVLRATARKQENEMQVTDDMVSRFLSWQLPKTFAPDCGISFDGRKDDEWNKNKTWPVGTNLLTAIEARAMLEHVLSEPA